MAVHESVAYEVIALHLQWRADRVDTETFIESIERVVADIESDEDVFELVLQLGSVAAGAVAASAAQLGRSPEELLQEAALANAVDAEDDED